MERSDDPTSSVDGVPPPRSDEVPTALRGDPAGARPPTAPLVRQAEIKSTYTCGTPCHTPSIAVKTVHQKPNRKIHRAIGPPTLSSRAAISRAMRAPPPP